MGGRLYVRGMNHESSTKAVTKPGRLQRWLTARKTLAWYTAEVLVIFLGITFSYLFDEWRDERKDRVAEAKLLRQFQKELALKLKEVKLDAEDKALDTLVAKVDSVTGIGWGALAAGQKIQIRYSDFIYFVNNAVQLKRYLFVPATPSYESANAGNLWPLIPDSIKAALYEINLKYINLNKSYNAINSSSSVVGDNAIRLATQYGSAWRQGDRVALSPEAFGSLVVWSSDIRAFQSLGSLLSPPIDKVQELIRTRLISLGK
jgi:hypothetical protein